MSEKIPGDYAAPELPGDGFEAGEDLIIHEADAARSLSDGFHNAKRIIVPVNPARLAWGRFDRKQNRDAGEGDINASYSADTIATAGKIRKAFRWQAQLMVTVSLSRRSGVEQAEAYQLITLKVFGGTPMSYAEKTETSENADAARHDPNGFYHGMKVTQGKEAFLLSGPSVVFVAEEAPARPDGSASADGEQLSLF